MKKRVFVVWVASLAAGLAWLASCNEEQIARADQVAAGVGTAVTTGQQLLESPTGQVLPPDWRLYGSIAVAVGSIAVGAYEKWRLTVMTKTTKAIVKGIEKAEERLAVNPTNPVKECIGKEMRSAGIYDQGNRLVDQLKLAR